MYYFLNKSEWVAVLCSDMSFSFELIRCLDAVHRAGQTHLNLVLTFCHGCYLRCCLRGESKTHAKTTNPSSILQHANACRYDYVTPPELCFKCVCRVHQDSNLFINSFESFAVITFPFCFSRREVSVLLLKCS
jgi:hypothetical protein